MRVSGTMYPIEDEVVRQSPLAERGFLFRMAGVDSNEHLEDYRMTVEDAHIWTMQDFLKEQQLEHLLP